MPYKLPKALLIFSAVTCALIRAWIKLMMVDPATGFYREASMLIPFFNLLLVFSAVALFVLALLPQKNSQPFDIRWQSPLVRVTALGCALGCIAAAWSGVVQQYDVYLSTFNGGAPLGDLLQFSLLMAGRVLLFAGLPLLSALVWLRLAIRPQPRRSPINPYLSLAPPLWLGALAIYYFLDFTTMRSVSDQRLSMTMLVLAAPFTLALARLLSDTDRSRGLRQLMLFGFPSALLSIATSTGMIAGALAGRGSSVALPSALGLVFFPLFGLHTLALLYSTAPEAPSDPALSATPAEQG